MDASATVTLRVSIEQSALITAALRAHRLALIQTLSDPGVAPSQRHVNRAAAYRIEKLLKDLGA